MALDGGANTCFVCGPANPIGLHIEFRLEEGVCRGEYTPTSDHVGYDGVVHGGIVFSMLDDVMANLLYLGGERCFTAKAEVRYRQALPVDVPVRLEGRLAKRKGRLAMAEGQVIRDDDQTVVAEATASFMLG